MRKGKNMKKIPVLILWALLLAGCNGYSLVPPTAQTMNGMTVTPATAWNKSPATLGKNVVSWTADGPLLNEVIFFAGVEEGSPLIKAKSKGQRPPKFRADMLPNEIMELVEATVSLITNSTLISTNNLKPRLVGGLPGFEFDLDYVARNEVERRGRVIGTIQGGKLYLVLYQAPSLYYFDETADEVDQLVSSISFN